MRTGSEPWGLAPDQSAWLAAPPASCSVRVIVLESCVRQNLELT